MNYKIKIKDLECFTLSKTNFTEVLNWLERNHVIHQPCHQEHSIWMILDNNGKEEETVAYQTDVIVKIGNGFRIYSQRGFELFLEKCTLE